MPKGNVFKNRLAQMQTAANDAMQGYIPGGLQVPDDIYNARVQGELTESQAGNLMITRTFTVMEGDYQGLKIWDHIVLEKLDDDGETRIPSYMGIIQSRRWLESMGIEFPEDDLGQLDEIITQISDCAPACRIRSKTSKSKNSDDEYTHVTVLELLDWGEGNPVEETTEDIPTEDAAPEEEQGEEQIEEEGGDDITIEDLLTFAASQGITELNDSMDGETIVATLLTYQYKENELTDEEKAMLIAIGLPEEQIIAAVPKQVKVTPPPKKTVAKTTTKTVAKTPPKPAAPKRATPPPKTPAKGKLPPRIGKRK